MYLKYDLWNEFYQFFQTNYVVIILIVILNIVENYS